MIKESLLNAERAGARTIMVDAARDSRAVTAFDQDGPCARATHILASHVYVLTAILARWSGQHMTITDALRRVGYTMLAATRDEEQR